MEWEWRSGREDREGKKVRKNERTEGKEDIKTLE